MSTEIPLIEGGNGRQNRSDVACAQSPPLPECQLPTLHQTTKSNGLSIHELQWRESWLCLGFRIRTADDNQARRDIQAADNIIGSILHVYDGLETNVQRADVWRYAILWLYGGVYADMDIVARAPLAELTRSHRSIIFSESIAVFDHMPSAVSSTLSKAFLAFGWTDLVRLPQRRNCIIVAPANSTLMLRTLQLVVAKFNEGTTSGHRQKQEPTHTLELTGPGIFTDAIRTLTHERGDEVGHMLIHRHEGARYFQHIGTGSWKTYREGSATRGGMQLHERNLLGAVVAIHTVFVALFVFALRYKRGKPFRFNIHK